MMRTKLAVILAQAALFLTVRTGLSEEARLPRLAALEPGLRVGVTVPREWSHLILKSVPRLASGDLASLPEFAKATATRFRTIFLVEVSRSTEPSGRHRLVRMGVGLGVPDGPGEGDLIVRSGSAEARRTLGALDRKVLDEAQAELEKASPVASTPTMIVIAAPSTRLGDERHEACVIYYAVVVEPGTGEPTTFVWALPRPEFGKVAGTRPRRLPPGLIDSCAIDVRATRIFGAVPVGWSFAMKDLPKGVDLEPSPTLARWLVSPRLIRDSPSTFEELIRASR